MCGGSSLRLGDLSAMLMALYRRTWKRPVAEFSVTPPWPGT